MTDIDNRQESLVLNSVLVSEGLFPSSGGGSSDGLTLGMIRTFAFSDNGGLSLDRLSVDTGSDPLAINQNTPLFSLVGSTFGGDGESTFKAPDLSGRVAVGAGNGPGLTDRRLGQEFGSNDVTLQQSNLTAQSGGVSAAVDNVQESTTINYLINIGGEFPSRSGGAASSNLLGQVIPTATNFAPSGFAFAQGQLLPISQNEALFSIIGTIYGGDGRTTFALPDLRGRVPEGAGPQDRLGQRSGVEDNVLLANQIPTTPTDTASPINNEQPTLALNYIISLNGLFGGFDASEPSIGEVMLFAGTFAPAGFAFAEGQLLPIAQNSALFSLLGTQFGGDGRTTFALPDLRGRVLLDEADGLRIGQVVGSDTETLVFADVADLAETPSLVVTTNSDVVDALDGETSLREAIEFANSNADDSVITFASGVGEAFENGGEIVLAGQELVLSTNIAIDGDLDGDGTADITLNGNDASRVLKISAGDADLDGLIVTGGNTSGFGGGIYVGRAGLTFSDGAITGNTSAGLGGGLVSFGFGALTIEGSEITGNSAVTGGGLALSGSTPASVLNTTISGNYAISAGGGVEVDLTPSSSVTFTNTTVANNTSGALGGGISLDYGTVNLVNSTVTGNDSSHGGGLFEGDMSDGVFALTNSIVLGNSATISGDEIFGNHSANSGSITSGDAANVFAAIDETTGGGQLADNGGAVQTVALRGDVTNPALEIGTAPVGVTTDARGETRDVDLPDVDNGGTVDAGAFELRALPESASLVVTTASDVVDAFDGLTSLREAVAFANSDADQSDITFDADLAGETITLTDGVLALTSDISIDGELDDDIAPDITISGNDASRIFSISGDGTDVALDSLALTNGQSANGGALLSYAGTTFTLTDSVVENSNAINRGGAFFTDGGTVDLVRSTFADNTAGKGGAIANVNGVLTVSASTIEGNTASGSGGGIYSNTSPFDTSTTTIENSTLYGNIAGSDADDIGGGVFNTFGPLEIRNSTIVGNSAGVAGGVGSSASGTTEITSSIIAGNTASVSGNDVGPSSIRSNGNNLIGDGQVNGTSLFADGVNGDIVGTTEAPVDPGLGTLGDNGGPTQTLALLAGSVAIDAGSNGAMLTTDQRGESRESGPADIGAVEFQDVTAPDAPTGLALALGSDLGASNSDNLTSDATPDIALTAEAGSTVTLTSDVDGVIGSGVADGSGDVTITAATLSNTVHQITAVAADAAGNVSATSSALSITVDTDAPDAPVITGISEDTGIDGDGVTSDASPSIQGTAEAGTVIELFALIEFPPMVPLLDDQASQPVTAAKIVAPTAPISLGTALVDDTGAFTLEVPLIAPFDGPATLTAVATDPAGNASATSEPFSVTLDTAAPAAPAGLDLVAGSDSGISNADDLTSDATPDFVVTAEAGSTVTLTSDIDGVIGTGTADRSGSVTITAATLSDEIHAITAVAVDLAGNASEASTALNVTIDTEDPFLGATNPLAGAVDVPLDQEIGLAFSEEVFAGEAPGAAIRILDRATGAVIEEIPVRLSVMIPTMIPAGAAGVIAPPSLTDPRLTLTGTGVLINPNADLPALTEITVEVDKGAFTDAAGNPIAPISGVDFTFTTEDPTNILGTAGADSLTGTTGADTLDGGGGDDLLRGAGGDDTLFGGLGDDDLNGGIGADSLFGGAGNDTLSGGPDASDDRLLGGEGDDRLLGGAGNDTLNGEDGADILVGGLGDDVLTGGIGGDLLNGGDGADALSGGAGADTLSGGAGADRMFGGDGADILVGGSGGDLLNGGADNDVLRGDAGADLLIGGLGDDTLSGGEGGDTLTGGEGADVVIGGLGSDILLGGLGSDTLNGGAEADVLRGGADADVLLGGDGDDVLQGGAGDDILRGDAGADRILFADGDGQDVVLGFGSEDVLIFRVAEFADIDDVTDALTVTASRLSFETTGGDRVTLDLSTGDLADTNLLTLEEQQLNQIVNNAVIVGDVI